MKVWYYPPMTKMNYTLVIFDIDGTLTELLPKVLAANPKQPSPNRLGEQQPKLGVVDKLAALNAAGIKLALATNRGGVAWGYNTLAEAQAIAREAAELCGIPKVPIYLCPHHPKARGPHARREFAIECHCRKPQPGMLVQAMGAAGVTPAETLFVGDMDSDQQAASSAGVAFAWADQFFAVS